MTDERMRDLERRALQGEPDAEVHLLRERVRLGQLLPSGIEIAAHLGHVPARRLLEWPMNAKDGWGEDPLANGASQAWRRMSLSEWVTEFGRRTDWLPVHAVRAAIALAHIIAPNAGREIEETVVAGTSNPFAPPQSADPVWGHVMSVYFGVGIEDEGLPELARLAAEDPGEEASARAVRDEVLPFVLGASDPLRTRTRRRYGRP